MLVAPPIAILAGGLATRLGDLTKQTPKSLLEVRGRPFLAWQLDLLAAHGLHDVVLCISHHGGQIERWCEENGPAGMRIRFSRDGDKQLGTGGALRRALPLLGERFLVTYGDSYLRCDYLAVFRHFVALQEHATESKRPLGLMTIFENRDQFDTSNVVFEDGRIVSYDKVHRTPQTRYIDWGLGILTADSFSEFAATQTLDLATVYQALVRRGQLAGFEVSERFFEVGSVAGIEALSAHLGQAGTAAG